MKNRYKQLQDRLRVAHKGVEEAFPGATRFTAGLFPRRRRSAPDTAEKIAKCQKVSAAAKKRKEAAFFEVPVDRRAPPKQKLSPTFKELSKAFKMRAAGKTSREIHDAFPHIRMITIFMNKAKDHPDYCQSYAGVARVKKIVDVRDLRPWKQKTEDAV